MRSVGGVFELAGLGVVAYSIEETRQWLRRRSSLSIVGDRLTAMKAALGRRVAVLLAALRRVVNRLRGRRPITGHATATLGALIAEAAGSVTPRKSYPVADVDWDTLAVDERVAELVAIEERHRQWIAGLRTDMQDQHAALHAAITSERERAEVEEHRIEGRIVTFVGNDVQLQAIGAVVLFFGIILTTWSGEIVRNWPLDLILGLLAVAGIVAIVALMRSRLSQRAREPDYRDNGQQ